VKSAVYNAVILIHLTGTISQAPYEDNLGLEGFVAEHSQGGEFIKFDNRKYNPSDCTFLGTERACLIFSHSVLFYCEGLYFFNVTYLAKADGQLTCDRKNKNWIFFCVGT
jgi:hypothetical protein